MSEPYRGTMTPIEDWRTTAHVLRRIAQDASGELVGFVLAAVAAALVFMADDLELVLAAGACQTARRTEDTDG